MRGGGLAHPGCRRFRLGQVAGRAHHMRAMGRQRLMRRRTRTKNLAHTPSRDRSDVPSMRRMAALLRAASVRATTGGSSEVQVCHCARSSFLLYFSYTSAFDSPCRWQSHGVHLQREQPEHPTFDRQVKLAVVSGYSYRFDCIWSSPEPKIAISRSWGMPKIAASRAARSG